MVTEREGETPEERTEQDSQAQQGEDHCQQEDGARSGHFSSRLQAVSLSLTDSDGIERDFRSQKYQLGR